MSENLIWKTTVNIYKDYSPGFYEAVEYLKKPKRKILRGMIISSNPKPLCKTFKVDRRLLDE